MHPLAINKPSERERAKPLTRSLRPQPGQTQNKLNLPNTKYVWTWDKRNQPQNKLNHQNTNAVWVWNRHNQAQNKHNHQNTKAVFAMGYRYGPYQIFLQEERTSVFQLPLQFSAHFGQSWASPIINSRQNGMLQGLSTWVNSYEAYNMISQPNHPDRF